MKKELAEQYNNIGDDYISGQSGFFSDVEDEAFEYLSRNIPLIEGQVILDLGCGNGNDIMKYQKQNPRSIFGIDSSELMIDKAKLRVSHPENLFTANMEQTGIDSNFFDIITSRYALHYLETFELVYTEIGRILKPGGTFSFVVPHPFRDFTLQQNKKYGEKEILEVKLYDGKVTIKYPAHILQDYFSDTFCSNFKLVNFEEVSQSDEYEKDGYSLPGFIGITAIKLNS